ncbi:MAG: hypothetical protein MRY83_11045, partial [Flavobacteriales bacterium]|nr:hypothetical protein [Flavobacteriales bacterium]
DITDKSTGDLYGTYLPNFYTMRYIMILPPGKYDYYLEVPGYEVISEEIEIFDKSSFRNEIRKDVVLIKK